MAWFFDDVVEDDGNGGTEKPVLPDDAYDVGVEDGDRCPKCGAMLRVTGGVVFCPDCDYKEVF